MQERRGRGGQQLARDFGERWFAEWNTREPDRILSLCTEDVVWDEPLFPRALEGREQVRDSLRSTFKAFPDLEFVLPVEAFESLGGEKLALYWDREGTMLGSLEPPGFEPTHRRVQFDGIDMLELRDGLVSRLRSRPDARFLQQIGALPFAGSRAERLAVLVQRLQARRMRWRSD